MNILPKKRWHVRTRENIARVRRDEAKAAEEERAKKARAQKAETEARINALRDQARIKYDGRDSSKEERNKAQINEHEHVNFFKDLEEGIIDHHRPNAEHEAETKAEKEKYEKQIGYLTYLGQDTNEATGNKNWYDEVPRRLSDPETKKEVQENKKIIDDPMTDIRRYLSIMGSSSSISKTKVDSPRGKKRKLESNSDDDIESKKIHKKDKKKSKHHRSSKSEHNDSEKKNNSSVNIEKLRAARLLREQTEKLRTEALLAKLRGDPLPIAVKEEAPKTGIRQKYNSQFCPEIARQNMEPTPRRSYHSRN